MKCLSMQYKYIFYRHILHKFEFHTANLMYVEIMRCNDCLYVISADQLNIYVMYVKCLSLILLFSNFFLLFSKTILIPFTTHGTDIR